MLGVLHGFVLILGVMLAGYIAARAGVVRGEQRLVLNKLAFNVATPCLLFALLQKSDPRVMLSPVIGVTTLAAIVCGLIYALLARFILKRDAGSVVMGAATSGYANSNNLGLPVALYIIGDAIFIPPLILTQLLVLVPVMIVALEWLRNPGKGGLRGFGLALSRAAKNPIILGSLAGVAWSCTGLHFPDILLGPIDMIGHAAVPMVLLSFGVSLHGQRALGKETDRPPVILSVLLKVLLMPALALLLGHVFGLGEHELYAATVLAALPTAQNSYIYAATYRVAELQVRDSIFVSTFASLPVIAVIALLFKA